MSGTLVELWTKVTIDLGYVAHVQDSGVELHFRQLMSRAEPGGRGQGQMFG